MTDLALVPGENEDPDLSRGLVYAAIQSRRKSALAHLDLYLICAVLRRVRDLSGASFGSYCLDTGIAGI